MRFRGRGSLYSFFGDCARENAGRGVLASSSVSGVKVPPRFQTSVASVA
jgi:hypothetical protein